MKIGHFSDTHLGYKMYNLKQREKDFFSAFEESLDVFINKDVDVVIHTGDLFHSNNPSVEVINFFLKGIKKLENNDIDFCGVVGNHEKRRDMDWIDHFEDFGLCYHLGKKPFTVDDVCIYGIDNINKNELDSNFNMKNSDSDFKVLCTHNIFNPPVSGVVSDFELESFLNKINIDIDLILSGDHHENNITKFKDKHIIYSGSTEKTSFGDGKSYVNIITLNNEKTEVRKNRISNREFIEHDIKEDFDFDEFMKDYENISSKELDPILRLNIMSNKFNEDYSKIRSICRDLGFLKCRINDISEEKKDSRDVESINFNEEILNKVREDDISNKTKNIIELCLNTNKENEDEIRSYVEEILK